MYRNNLRPRSEMLRDNHGLHGHFLRG
jgi:hypothetical protein